MDGNKITKWLLLLFFVLHYTLLAFWVHSIDGKYDNEVFLLYGMIFLITTFPISIVSSMALIGLSTLFPFLAEHTPVSAVSHWGIYFVFGCIQWFFIVPWLWNRIRRFIHAKKTQQREMRHSVR